MLIRKAFRMSIVDMIFAPFGGDPVDRETCASQQGSSIDPSLCLRALSSEKSAKERGWCCRVRAQEIIAHRTPALHQRSSPTRYPCFPGSDDAFSARSTSVESSYGQDNVAAPARRREKYRALLFGCFRQRRHDRG